MKKMIMVIFSMFAFLGINGLSSAEIQNQAKFLGFDGNYMNASDPLLSFDGNGDWFAGNIKSFTLTIANATAANKDVVLFPGFMQNARPATNIPLVKPVFDAKLTLLGTITELDGTIEIEDQTSLDSFTNFMKIYIEKMMNSINPFDTNEVVITDGVVFEDLDGDQITCSGAPSDIRFFLTYLMSHPSWLQSMKISSDKASQMQQNITLTELNPFHTERNHVIPLTKFTTNKDNISTMIDFEVNQTIDDLTKMSINVVANSTIDITFFFGASLSTGKYVTERAKEAAQQLILNGATAVKANQLRAV